MHQFYDPSINADSNFHVLNEEESKHACKVMRLVSGDEIAILNGKGFEFIAKIIEAHPKQCKIEIISKFEEERPKADLNIAIAPTKNIDRIEWFLEKATEMGVTEISLLMCSNSERKIVKEERLEKIIIAAMKQSKRLFLPKLNSLIDFKSFLKKHPNGLIAHCYDGEKQTIAEIFKQKNSPILIGPEGDFSLIEVNEALKSGYKTISLGKNRLRTETAGLVAVMQAKLLIDN